MFLDILYSTFTSGGWVMLPLFLCGCAGFFFVLNAMNKLGRDLFRRDLSVVLARFADLLAKNDLEGARSFLRENKGLVTSQLLYALDNAEWSEHHLRMVMTERISARLVELDKGMHLAGVMATSAPLLGLLGTVAGMISTFEVLTNFGNSNPLLLADGISEALVATQSGLLIAIPLLLLQNHIEDRNRWVRKQLEYGMTTILNWASSRRIS